MHTSIISGSFGKNANCLTRLFLPSLLALTLTGCGDDDNDPGAAVTVSRYTVSTTVGTGGDISDSSLSVKEGESAIFTLTPDTGYHVDQMSGCDGSLSGNDYSTGPITGDCTVTASFALNRYTIEVNSTGGGSVDPATREVEHGSTTSFILNPDAGYGVAAADGCSGSLSGNEFITGSIIDNCTVNVEFARTYKIGGTVTGLGTGLELALLNQGGDELKISADGNFSFLTPVVDGKSYSVTVGAQPASRECTVSQGAGTVNGAEVADVTVDCIIAPPPAPEVVLDYSIKQLIFSWPAVDGATYYQLFENSQGTSGYSQIGSDFTDTLVSHDIFLPERVNAKYLVSACNSAGCTDSTEIFPAQGLVPPIGYAKASNTGDRDTFGGSVAISSDGNTLVVGADGEDSAATTVNGDQNDDTAGEAGAVYVFNRDGSSGQWSQQAYLKASNSEADDRFGYALDLSGDGNILAVGAYNEASGTDGVDGDQANNFRYYAGAVYIFERDTGTGNWSQTHYIKASNSDYYDRFGYALALAADGRTLAVGAFGEASSATGMNGDQTDNSAENAGAVYVYARDSGTGGWSQQAYIKASNGEGGTFQTGDRFGDAVSLSANGDTLAVGAYGEASGIPGDQNDNSTANAGAAYIFVRDGGGNWSQQAYLKASNAEEDDYFSDALALAPDGNTLAVGAPGEASTATAVNGDQSDNSGYKVGATYIFTRDSATGIWTQQAYLKAPKSGIFLLFGTEVAFGGDGNSLAVGGPGDNSMATGLNGDLADDSARASGAVYLFRRDPGTGEWQAPTYVKASNSGESDSFGGALDYGTGILAVAALNEKSAATGICATANTECAARQSDDSISRAGAVYLY